MEALWYSFSKILQIDLDKMKEYWNTHYIRKNDRYETISGRPDVLYFLPEQNKSADYKQEVAVPDFDDVSEHVVVKDYSNEYTEYFNYLVELNNLNIPTDWTEALYLYNFFVSVM